jgi:large subunit ribosomal protein L24e
MSSFSVEAMMRVEEIKGKRQSQYIFDRQKKARQIEKEKDIKEVKRDLALIRSPAAGKNLTLSD